MCYLSDCHVSRIRLLFCIAATAERPASPIFAYIKKYLPIPSTPESATNMFVLSKPARERMDFVDVAQITRVCPLSPRISGTVTPGITPETTLDTYKSFYINKYHSTSDFVYMIQL